MTKLVAILSVVTISFTAHANIEKIRACQDAGRPTSLGTLEDVSTN
jgi:hypothetical protein